MTYKELIESMRQKWIGAKVLYEGEKHTVVGVDYNGESPIQKLGQCRH